MSAPRLLIGMPLVGERSCGCEADENDVEMLSLVLIVMVLLLLLLLFMESVLSDGEIEGVVLIVVAVVFASIADDEEEEEEDDDDDDDEDDDLDDGRWSVDLGDSSEGSIDGTPVEDDIAADWNCTILDPCDTTALGDISDCCWSVC